jgi:hypothetical protein
MKDAGEKFILRWLWTERGTNNEDHKVYNMDLIPSPGLIEELIGYFRGGNFDRVMALMQVMFMVEESYEEEVGAKKRRNKAADYLVSNISSMFSRSRR